MDPLEKARQRRRLDPDRYEKDRAVRRHNRSNREMQWVSTRHLSIKEKVIAAKLRREGMPLEAVLLLLRGTIFPTSNEQEVAEDLKLA